MHAQADNLDNSGEIQIYEPKKKKGVSGSVVEIKKSPKKLSYKDLEVSKMDSSESPYHEKSPRRRGDDVSRSPIRRGNDNSPSRRTGRFIDEDED